MSEPAFSGFGTTHAILAKLPLFPYTIHYGPSNKWTTSLDKHDTVETDDYRPYKPEHPLREKASSRQTWVQNSQRV